MTVSGTPSAAAVGESLRSGLECERAELKAESARIRRDAEVCRTDRIPIQKCQREHVTVSYELARHQKACRQRRHFAVLEAPVRYALVIGQ